MSDPQEFNTQTITAIAREAVSSKNFIYVGWKLRVHQGKALLMVHCRKMNEWYSSNLTNDKMLLVNLETKEIESDEEYHDDQISCDTTV